MPLDHGERLPGPTRRHPGVDGQRAAVHELGGRRRRPSRRAPAAPGPPGTAGSTGRPAEHLLQHVEGHPVRRPGSRPPASRGRGGPARCVADGRHRLGRRPAGSRGPAARSGPAGRPGRRGRPCRVDHRVVVDGPGRGHDQVGRAVPAVEEGADRLGGHGRHRLLGADHVPAQGVVGEQRPPQQLVDHLLGAVVGGGQLLEDHLPLGDDVLGPQQRVGHDVGQQLEPHRRGPGRAPAGRRPCAPWRCRR